jgi:hypothetical protein
MSLYAFREICKVLPTKARITMPVPNRNVQGMTKCTQQLPFRKYFLSATERCLLCMASLYIWMFMVRFGWRVPSLLRAKYFVNVGNVQIWERSAQGLGLFSGSMVARRVIAPRPVFNYNKIAPVRFLLWTLSWYNHGSTSVECNQSKRLIVLSPADANP